MKYNRLNKKYLIIISSCLIILFLLAIVFIFIKEESAQQIELQTKSQTLKDESKAGVMSEMQTSLEAEPTSDTQPSSEIEISQTESELADVSEKQFLVFNGDQFNQLFNEADLKNLQSIEGVDPPAITGGLELDARIRMIAKERGYRHRPEVLDRGLLIPAEANTQHLLQPQAAQAYFKLKAAAAADGHSIHVVSAFRDYNLQRTIFLNQIASSYKDEDINEVLKLYSIPGYSKHHTGYTIDLGAGSLIFQDFAQSESYAWLSANNYLNAKKYGWIPSYPPDATNQGPDPESWEFTYVGTRYLIE